MGLVLEDWGSFPGTRAWEESVVKDPEKVFIIRIIFITRGEEVSSIEGFRQFGQI